MQGTMTQAEEMLQALAAALVLVEADDPSSYRDALRLQEELAGNPDFQSNAAGQAILARIQEALEACILDSDCFPERMKDVEEDLKSLRRLLQDAPEGEAQPAVDSLAEGREEASADGQAPGRVDAPVQESVDSPPKPPEAPMAGLHEDRELLEDFLLEAGENLDAIEVEILRLEKEPGNLEVINEVFRPFHTIKGVSGFLNLDDINRLTHRLEDLLDGARRGEVVIGNAEIEAILGAVDLLKRLLASVGDRLAGRPGQAGLTQEVTDFLETLRRGKPSPCGDSPGDAPEVPPLGQVLEIQGKLSREDVDAALREQSAVPERRIGEILVGQGKVSEDDVASAVRLQTLAAEGEETSGHRSATIKVDMSRLDNLVNMVGELVIAQSLVQQNPEVRRILDHRLARDFGQLARITAELRDTTMSLRMVPLRQTFQRMIRLVRDLSRRSGKAVKLVMTGEETEIDRNMVDTIYEPLVHLVRNSVDHGIEAREARVQAGKPETGTVRLQAYHKGGHVVIEIQDDGQGLNRERILEKARSRGWVKPDETPADHEIDQFIFQAGFSTAAQVTEVSGRGVGMDVVKKTIEKLRGKIEIRSVPGQGCTFLIQVPMTLAIIDGILVAVGKERFVLPTTHIREAFRPKPEDYVSVMGQGELIRIRGALLPLVRLHRLFDIPTEKHRPWDCLVVVVENDGESCCLLVDQVLQKQEVVIKSLGEAFSRQEGVSGGSILGDGRVGLILDVNGVFRLKDRYAGSGAGVLAASVH